MPIRANILSVERPVNTVVIVYGKTKDHYAVNMTMEETSLSMGCH